MSAPESNPKPNDAGATTRVEVEGIAYGPVPMSSAWWAQRRPDLDRYLSPVETWPLLDRLLALEAQLASAREVGTYADAIVGDLVRDACELDGFAEGPDALRITLDELAMVARRHIEPLLDRIAALEAQLAKARGQLAYIDEHGAYPRPSIARGGSAPNAPGGPPADQEAQ